MNEHPTDRYITPTGAVSRFAGRLTGRTVAGLAGLGISLMGSRILAVKGRKSGQWRTVPVNLLVVDGVRYLVAPRGHTQWVRNMRAAGGGELRLGRRVEEFTATELADTEKPPVIHAYLERWGWEVGMFFENLDKNSTTEEILAVAPGFPVFRIG